MSNKTKHVAIWKSGSSVSWRGLTMREYNHFSRRLQFEPEMLVYCDLYREVVDTTDNATLHQTTAGVVAFIGSQLLLHSPYSGDYELIKQTLAKKREELATDYFEQCKAVIAGIFKYSFEEIDSWDSDTFFDRLAKAELITEENLEPHTQEEIAAANRQVQTGSKPQSEKLVKKPLTPTQKLVLDRKLQASR